MTRFKLIILVCALTMSALSAFAWDGVEVLEAAGQLRRHVFAASTPTPAYCYWEHTDAPAPAFHATNADGYGNSGCVDPWLVHCDGDSLVFQGAWPLIDSTYVTCTEYLVDLSCSVNISTETRMRVGRSVVAGELDTDVHALNITYPDGTSVPILAAGSGPDQAQLVLQPGIYQVTLNIHAYQNKSYSEIVDPYEGRVWLAWEDPLTVDVDKVSWDSLKSAFRP